MFINIEKYNSNQKRLYTKHVVKIENKDLTLICTVKPMKIKLKGDPIDVYNRFTKDVEYVHVDDIGESRCGVYKNTTILQKTGVPKIWIDKIFFQEDEQIVLLKPVIIKLKFKCEEELEKVKTTITKYMK